MRAATKQAEDRCSRCGKAGFPLYENPQRPKRELCFPCLDAEAPEVVRSYPGWREREARRERKAQQAISNFHNGRSAPPLASTSQAGSGKPNRGNTLPSQPELWGRG